VSITTDPTPLPKNYQWPADKLTTKEMAILHRLRQQTGTPINHLLREAVLKLKEFVNGANHQQMANDENSKEKEALLQNLWVKLRGHLTTSRL
jgi:hypothetical protein